MNDFVLNPAESAAKEALARMYACIDASKSFRLEAGAGAGKTYSLIEALKYLIIKRGENLLRQHQQVACISYTNVASDEIASRIDRHPTIHSSTIHSFCWLLIKDFQPYLRVELPNINNWAEKLEECGGVGTRNISYDEMGHRAISETNISLHHDDVLVLTIKLMEQDKFRILLTNRYPILFIDEYQDTDRSIAEALKRHFLDTGGGLLIGFFGDHWQKIYGTGCGKIEHPSLESIGKESNFRSVPVIVENLNRMRPDLPQQVKDPEAEGFLAIYHTNNWVGERRTGQHWDGDLPAEFAHAYLDALTKRLTDEGWDFTPNITKILMLTHNVLAKEQGYSGLLEAFKGNNERVIKKEDPHIKFLVETLEPVCTAYENKCYGEMFRALGTYAQVSSHADKEGWTRDMDALLKLRSTNTIGAVLDHLKQTKRPRLPDAVERREQELRLRAEDLTPEEQRSIECLRSLRDVSYQEIIPLTRFIDEKTPFSTKHGVKGAEFENVLVVFGRGWNLYNFNQFLEWAGAPRSIPSNKLDTFERNRNLFYVACSRPKKRLALLFTQKLSDQALTTLSEWFGENNIHSIGDI